MITRINGKATDEIRMKGFNKPDNISIAFPKHRVTVQERTETGIVLKMPQPLVIQMLWDGVIVPDPNRKIKLEITGITSRYYFLRKITFSDGFTEAYPVYLHFEV
ncbi:MAG: hypothetical protein A2460_03090 [Omnitrophica WOR_2 bacterium RIFOXYC2_FULL_43_9]|nr:MAG: hypothetical protein A2X01_00165 [Bacteroidetes bacterium GWF2_35_48]OFY76328.1 MAG: hypothetical protein A2275_02170 [Bacteroidetes bacterium RIFOXYA12_FULL_35_11]OFZ04624.1 MAG: hypothetical protein A2491_11675 [Bacteroidetes bacterium RIFOXYC12_FULL_35_7]OGX53848.1 MAG: hypothetical protein A2460_03090 [Omnitrophica WOR_2 bacterium RIFOXYC2_FULL_43_9]